MSRDEVALFVGYVAFLAFFPIFNFAFGFFSGTAIDAIVSVVIYLFFEKWIDVVFPIKTGGRNHE